MHFEYAALVLVGLVLVVFVVLGIGLASWSRWSRSRRRFAGGDGKLNRS